jgi:glycerophosphoryl diester phosphodiesterase
MFRTRWVWVCFAFVIGCTASAPKSPAPNGRSARAVDYQGHRGARGLRPENTLDAFAYAIDLGVDTIELDVMLSADNVLVVHHDERLNPDITRDASDHWLPGVGPPLRSLPFAELQRYDVGRIRPLTKYAGRFAQQVGGDGVRIPALADVIELAEQRSRKRIRYNIEIKTTPDHPDDTAPPAVVADKLVELVKRAGIAERTTIQSFDWRSLRRAAAIAPAIRRSCLTSADTVQVGAPGASPWTDGLDVDGFGGSVPQLVRAAGCALWSPDATALTRAEIAEAHRLGLAVVPWTVNEPADMTRLIEWGVDGLISDFPDRLPRR